VKRIAWCERARADIRRLDRETALWIFAAFHRLAEIGEGDVKKLRGKSGELRFASATTACASPRNRRTLCAFTPSTTASKPTANQCFAEHP